MRQRLFQENYDRKYEAIKITTININIIFRSITTYSFVLHCDLALCEPFQEEHIRVAPKDQLGSVVLKHKHRKKVLKPQCNDPPSLCAIILKLLTVTIINSMYLELYTL